MVNSTILSAMMSLNLRSVNGVMLYFRGECSHFLESIHNRLSRGVT